MSHFDTTERHVRAAFSAAFPQDEITGDSHFFDLGGDSVKAVEIMATLSEAMGQELHASLLLFHPQVSGLARAAADLCRT